MRGLRRGSLRAPIDPTRRRRYPLATPPRVEHAPRSPRVDAIGHRLSHAAPPTTDASTPSPRSAGGARAWDIVAIVGLGLALAASGALTLHERRALPVGDVGEVRLAGLGTGVAGDASVVAPWERHPATITTQTHRSRRLLGSDSNGRAGPYRVWGANEATVAEPEGFELRTALGRARVYIREEDGGERPCSSYRFGRWHCGPEPWLWVGPTELSVRDRSAECIWFHPPDEGTIVVEWSDPGPGGTLTGRYAFADVAADNSQPGDGSFVVRWNGEAIVERVVEQRRGFRRYTGLAPLREGETTLSVEFSSEVTAQRHFCFDGRWRPTPPPTEEP